MNRMRQSQRTASPGSPATDEDLTASGLLDFVLQHRRLILGTGLAAFLLVAGVALTRSRTYTSTARFMPQSSEGTLSQLSGLAATFGVSVPASDQGSSPNFYAELLKSRDVLRRTVETRYAFAARGDSMRGTLIELFEVGRDTPAARRDKAAKALLESIEVGIGRETGTINLQVSTAWPELSQQVAARMIQLVSEFNLNRRQTKAGAERRFVEARLDEAKDTLRAAEARLEGFLQRNRAYQNSPQLLFEHDRLERQVAMRQQVYTSLAQSYEGARIDEVRNTPVITLMEPPDLPAKPDARLALVKGIFAGLVGLALGAFLAALWQAFGRPLRGLTRRTAREEPVPAGADGPGRRPLVPTAAGPDGG